MQVIFSWFDSYRGGATGVLGSPSSSEPGIREEWRDGAGRFELTGGYKYHGAGKRRVME